MNSELSCAVVGLPIVLRHFGQLWLGGWPHSVLSVLEHSRPAYPVRHGSWHPLDRASRASGITRLMPNYALERSVRACGWRAAGARRDFAPAARWNGFARPAQRGR